MEKLIERLLGRPFMAPEGEGNGAGGGGSSGAGGSSDAGGAVAASGGGSGQQSGDGGGEAKGGAKPSAADIAKRSGGAFSKAKPQAAAGDAGAGAEGSADDGVDPATKPKPGANGKGERPAHVPEKFWDAATGQVRADDLAKAYGTLETAHAQLKAGKGLAGEVGEKAEDYLPEGIPPWQEGKRPDRVSDIDPKDPALDALRKVGLKLKLPKDIVQGIAVEFLTELNPHLPIAQTEEDIIKDLGEGGAALRDELGVWMEGQYSNGFWSEEELEFAFSEFGKSARGVRLLAKLREAAGEKPIPIPLGKVGDGATPSVEEYHAMHRDPRYKSDPAFREKVEAAGLKIFGDEPAGTVAPGHGVPLPKAPERRERASTQR